MNEYKYLTDPFDAKRFSYSLIINGTYLLDFKEMVSTPKTT